LNGDSFDVTALCADGYKEDRGPGITPTVPATGLATQCATPGPFSLSQCTAFDCTSTFDAQGLLTAAGEFRAVQCALEQFRAVSRWSELL
jgi:hypothetical protein